MVIERTQCKTVEVEDPARRDVITDGHRLPMVHTPTTINPCRNCPNDLSELSIALLHRNGPIAAQQIFKSLMHIPLTMAQTYPTPFKTHLVYFLPSPNTTLIHFSDSLRGWLSLGLNLPVSLVAATGMQIIYGNTGSVVLGPFRAIDIKKVRNERYMLEDLPISDHSGCDLSRPELMEAVKGKSAMDRFHVWGLWAISARKDGRVAAADLKLIQQGKILWKLRDQRAIGRQHVLPFTRGGPGWVAGHSWAVDKLFGVDVYKDNSSEKRGR